MTIRTPIIRNGNTHDVLAAGDVFAGSAVQLSQDAGNALSTGSDGGLMASAASSTVGVAASDKDYTQLAWVAAGSPNTWIIDDVVLQIPDALLARTCLLICHVDAAPINSAAFNYYDSSTIAAEILPIFQTMGSPAGRLTLQPGSGMPLTWGMYLINPNRVQLPSGTTVTRRRNLNTVKFTADTGIIRVYEHMTLVPLG